VRWQFGAVTNGGVVSRRKHYDGGRFLRSLRQNDFTRILIGFEEVAHREGEKTESLSLSTNKVTVGDILNQLCRQSQRYTYEIVAGSIIHVYPAHTESSGPDLLGIRVRDFAVEGRMLPAAMIVRMGEFAPELASYLDQRKSEHYSHGSVAPSSPGAIGHGNMDPEVSLQLQDKTVREILNAVVLYSVQLRSKTPADSTGNRLPTTSWIYEFIIDPNAATGLGGTPRWIAF
jgi:hypothetical protein